MLEPSLDRKTDAVWRRVGSTPLEETDVLTAIFRCLAVGVVVCDTNAHILFFSPEAERILGIGAMHEDFVA